MVSHLWTNIIPHSYLIVRRSKIRFSKYSHISTRFPKWPLIFDVKQSVAWRIPIYAMLSDFANDKCSFSATNQSQSIHTHGSQERRYRQYEIWIFPSLFNQSTVERFKCCRYKCPSANHIAGVWLCLFVSAYAIHVGCKREVAVSIAHILTSWYIHTCRPSSVPFNRHYVCIYVCMDDGPSRARTAGRQTSLGRVVDLIHS